MDDVTTDAIDDTVETAHDEELIVIEKVELDIVVDVAKNAVNVC